MSNNINNRGQRWTFTLNNFTEQELDTISWYPCVFLIYGLEHVGDTLATPHVQGYVEFKNAKRLSTLKKWLPRAHFEKAKGTAEDNIRYCSKEDPTPFKKGVPMKNTKKPNAKRILKEDLVNGPRKLAAMNMLLGMKKEKEMFGEIMVDNLQKPEVIYIYGASGTGKTYTAYKEALQMYGIDEVSTIKFDKNGYAHCNNPHAECLVWMEFRPSCLAATDFLEFTDGYGTHLNVKYGGMYIRPKCLIICSILHPSEIYKEEINVQFQRRITKFINKDLNPYDPSNQPRIQEDTSTEEDFLDN